MSRGVWPYALTNYELRCYLLGLFVSKNRFTSRMDWRVIGQLIRLGRPLFLAGGFLWHGLGVVIALHEGAALHWPTILWGQIAITATQLLTHYSNEYFDLPADLANQTPTHWSGGSRVLVVGGIRPELSLLLAIMFGGLALLAAGVLVVGLRRGPWTLPLLFLALFLAWNYSSPPLRLHSRGVGELSAALLVPGLTPLVGFYLQVGYFTWLPLLAVWPLVCLQFVMLLTIEFPDAAGDGVAGKRTLVVRLGGQRAARLLVGVLGLAYGSWVGLVPAGLPPIAALSFLAISGPIALWLGWQMNKKAWAVPGRWNDLSFWAITLLMTATIAELIAFLSEYVA